MKETETMIGRVVMKQTELKMIERLSSELLVLAKNGYTFFDMACYIDTEIDNTSQSHSTAYFKFLHELKQLYIDLSVNE